MNTSLFGWAVAEDNRGCQQLRHPHTQGVLVQGYLAHTEIHDSLFGWAVAEVNRGTPVCTPTEAGSPNHLDDTVYSDQQVVDK